MEQFVREDAEAIFLHLLEDDDVGLLEFRDDGVRVPEHLRADKNAGPFHWSPACEFDGSGAPNPLVVPSLPFPFTAMQLAAFMVDGAGGLLREAYDGADGAWVDGPDEDEMLAIGAMATAAKRALREAYAAYRAAEKTIGPRDAVSGDTAAYIKWRKAIVLHLLRPRAEPQASPAQCDMAPGDEAVASIATGFHSGSDTPRSSAARGPTSMSRNALVRKYLGQWPTIESDLKNASTNGLSAAKAGSRGWIESRAVEWGKAKAKLEVESHADSSTKLLRQLPSRVNRLR